MNKRIRLLAALCACAVLTGCTSLLEREYSETEPHSSKFWDSSAAGTLRAETRQDVVNDLLLLIGGHTESAIIRLYSVEDDLVVSDMLEQAILEVQQETPMGAYAVEYIATTRQKQRSYYDISISISYRRTAEQVRSVTNATSPEALGTLLETALKNGRKELAVRVGYWYPGGFIRISEFVTELRSQRGLTEEDLPWLVYCYPDTENVGLLEFVLEPTEEMVAQYVPLPVPEIPEEGEGTAGEGGEDAAGDGEDAGDTAAAEGDASGEGDQAETPNTAGEENEKN